MKIILHCFDVVGKSMAGPAIRYWEFAKALSKHHEVVLLTPNHSDVTPEGFVLKKRTRQALVQEMKTAHVIVTQSVTHWMALHAKRLGVKIILDFYDPMPLENLERFKMLPHHLRDHKNRQVVNGMVFSFQMADAVLCANIKQRDLWSGLLMGLERITPIIYDLDPTLKNLIDIVPFGLPSTPPKHSGNGLKKMFNLKESDKVMLWGGGIWNWFDPLTLIKAIKQLSLEGLPIHLVFMGIKHPNERIPAMKMALDAVQLAKDLDLLDKYVFFNYEWTPYEQRQDFLLDADIGVSTHAEHLETQYSFRTRILDYIWAGLPMIATEGDSFADLIKSKELGVVVPYHDVAAIVQAVKHILSSKNAHTIQRNIADIRSQFYWENVVTPIDRLTHHLAQQPKGSLSMKQVSRILSSFYEMRGPRAIYHELLYQMRAQKG